MDDLSKILKDFDNDKSNLSTPKGKALINLASILNSLDYKKDCEHSIEDICAYFDNTLNENEKTKIEDLIFSCDSCFKTYSFLVENNNKISLNISTPQKLIDKVVESYDYKSTEKTKKNLFSLIFKNYYFSSIVAGISILFILFPLSQVRKDVDSEMNNFDYSFDKEDKKLRSTTSESPKSLVSKPNKNSEPIEKKKINLSKDKSLQDNSNLSYKKEDKITNENKINQEETKLVVKQKKELNSLKKQEIDPIQKQKELIYDLSDNTKKDLPTTNKSEESYDTSNSDNIPNKILEESKIPNENIENKKIESETLYKNDSNAEGSVSVKAKDEDNNLMAKRSVAKPPAPAMSMSVSPITPKTSLKENNIIEKPNLDKSYKEEKDSNETFRTIKINSLKLSKSGFIVIYQNNELIKKEKISEGYYETYDININSKEKVKIKIFEDSNNNNLLDSDDTLIREIIGI